MVLGLFGLALSACSLANPAARTFTSNNATPAAANNPQTADASDSEAKHGKHKKGSKGDKADEGNATPPKDPAAALAAAEHNCRDTARDNGIKSVLSIVTHLRPGAFDEEYVACMKGKGYDVTR
jgi:hypothetical protein